MINKQIHAHKYKKIINNSDKFIYNDKKNNRMIKLDKDSALQMKEKNAVSIYTPQIDPVQIAELSEKQQFVYHSCLPQGVLYYGYLPVGVIYPCYFDGYNTFSDLYKEDSKLILSNLKKAYYNNLELIHNDICNKDLSFKNIMYKDDAVELVDLDGYLIGKKYNSTYNQIYQYYLHDLYITLKRKLDALYGEDSRKLLKEINYLFHPVNNEIEEDYPLQVIESIEMKRILK